MQQQSLNSQTIPTSRCPNLKCGQPVKIGAKYCGICRQRITFCLTHKTLIRLDKHILMAEQRCEKCGEQLQICPSCGQAVHNTMQTCYACDAPLTTAFHNAATETLPPTPIHTENGNTTASKKNVAKSLTLDEVEQRLIGFAEHIKGKNADEYFPGALEQRTIIIQKWGQEIERAIHFTRLVKQHRIMPQHQEEIRKKLSEVVEQLDFVRPYEVKLIGHTGAGKSTLLAAMLREPLIPRGHGGAITSVPMRFRRCEANEAETMYVYFLKDRPVEKYSRQEWENEIKRFTTRPIPSEVAKATAQQEVNEVHLVDYVEFALDGDTHSELPPHVVVVDLPGSRATNQRDEEIFDAQLDKVDAVILVTNTKRVDNQEISEVLQKVKAKLEKTRDSSLVSRMVFMIATAWDGANTKEDVDRVVSNMNALVKELSPDYQQYHPCSYEDIKGQEHQCAFYSMRGEDAFWATMHIHETPASSVEDHDYQQVENYKGRVRAVRARLNKFDTTLDTISDIGKAQHEAMLQFSGLPKFLDDLRDFLAKNRFDVQLKYASLSLEQAMEILGQVGRDELRRHGLRVSAYSAEGLNDAVKEYEKGHQKRYHDEVLSRIDQMKSAWDQARQTFDEQAVKNPQSPFQQGLTSVHRRATNLLKGVINAGGFNYVLSGQQSAHSLPVDSVPKTIDLERFTGDLRARFWEAIQAEIKIGSGSPATALAQAFLEPLEEQEKYGDRPLDIVGYVSFGELKPTSPALMSYNDIKEEIKKQAEQICLSLTMSSLLSTHNSLKEDNNDLTDLKAFVEAHKLRDHAEIVEVHRGMEKILDTMVHKTIADTETAILHVFGYELDNFLKRIEVITNAPHLRERDGEFTKTVHGLRSEMEGYLRDLDHHPRLRDNLGKMFDKDKWLIYQWAEIVKEIIHMRAESSED